MSRKPLHLFPDPWPLAAVAIAAYAMLMARMILAAMRLVEAPELQRVERFYDNQGILLKGFNVLFYSPVVETLCLGGLYFVLKRLGVRQSLRIVASALPLVLAHLTISARDALASLPLFLISAYALDAKARDGWCQALAMVALAHGVYNITPFLNTLHISE